MRGAGESSQPLVSDKPKKTLAQKPSRLCALPLAMHSTSGACTEQTLFLSWRCCERIFAMRASWRRSERARGSAGPGVFWAPATTAHPFPAPCGRRTARASTRNIRTTASGRLRPSTRGAGPLPSRFWRSRKRSNSSPPPPWPESWETSTPADVKTRRGRGC